jgi:hypothetical protein
VRVWGFDLSQRCSDHEQAMRVTAHQS